MSEGISMKETIQGLSAYERCFYGGCKMDHSTGKVAIICRNGRDIDEGGEACEKCEELVSRFFEFPFQIDDILRHDLFDESFPGPHCGDIVAVRPCSGEGACKTYLGFSLGEFPSNIHLSYYQESRELEIGPAMRNPLIFIPVLRSLVWGYESWWHRIKSPDELKDITDEDIENVWYVQLINGMVSAGETSEERGSSE